MTHKHKMNDIEFLVFFLMAICSGFMIGISGAASLLSTSLYGATGRLIGAALFSLGIFTIITYEMRLFTGMVSDIPNMGKSSIWKLPVCLLGNAIGVLLIAGMLYFSPIAENIIPVAQNSILLKLNAEHWALKAFSSAIICGCLITLSVWAIHHTPRKGVSPTVGVLFPIIVFAFCGFDHCIANILYFCFLGEFSWRVIAYMLLVIFGNIVGGIILPLITLLRNHPKHR